MGHGAAHGEVLGAPWRRAWKGHGKVMGTPWRGAWQGHGKAMASYWAALIELVELSRELEDVLAELRREQLLLDTPQHIGKLEQVSAERRLGRRVEADLGGGDRARVELYLARLVERERVMRAGVDLGVGDRDGAEPSLSDSASHLTASHLTASHLIASHLI